MIQFKKIFYLVLPGVIFLVVDVFLLNSFEKKGTLYLADMEKPVTGALYTPLRIGRSYDNKEIIITGKSYPKALLTIPRKNTLAYLKYDLDHLNNEKKYMYFKSDVHIINVKPKVGKVEFYVKVDGRRIENSIRKVVGNNFVKKIVVSILGAKTLELIVDPVGENYSDHAVWLDPRLTEQKPVALVIVLLTAQIISCIYWVFNLIRRENKKLYSMGDIL